MQTEVTKQQIITFNSILKATGQTAEKRAIIADISNGRTTSTKGLLRTELQEWINAMRVAGRKPQPVANDPRKKMVGNIIAMAHEMGVIRRTTKVVPGVGLKTVNDYIGLKKWMLERSYLKKPLDDYTYDELPKLVSQYKNIYLSWLNQRQ